MKEDWAARGWKNMGEASVDGLVVDPDELITST